MTTSKKSESPAVLFEREQRKLGYVTATELAKALGCNNGTINRWFFEEKSVDGFRHLTRNYIKVNAALGARIRRALTDDGVKHARVGEKLAALGFLIVPGLYPPRASAQPASEGSAAPQEGDGEL